MKKREHKQNNSDKSTRSRKMTKRDAGIVQKLQRKDMTEMITPIATGVAVTAGVIAAGSVLAKKENREKLAKGAQKGMDILQEISQNMGEEAGGRYQAVASEITRRTRKRGRKARK